MIDETSRPDGSAAEPPSPGIVVSADQRRQLLRAVAGSGALLGAGLPLAAHASVRPHCRKSGYPHKYHPTASAVGSIIGSVTGTQPPVWGHPCSYYHSAANWPSPCSNGRTVGLTWDKCVNPTGTTKLRFYEVFELTNPGSGSTYRYCHEIISTHAGTDEHIWLTAMFNANKLVGTFTYTASQVIDLYNSRNPILSGMTQTGLNNNAKELFRDYLSQGMPS
jgi:hypothetical protein